MTDRIVGIDLGTSNSVVACVDEMDVVRVIADADGDTIHPSVVSFHIEGQIDVGFNAKQRQIIEPKNTIYSAKRMIGQPFDSHAVRETARRAPFTIKKGPKDLPLVVTCAGEFAIPEISGLVLQYMAKIAGDALGSPVKRAVVTVPASFTEVQRSSTATAGRLVGLDVVRVLNEPTAAALAYGSLRPLHQIIAVYDFGGGTFDITILELNDQIYTVLGTSGDSFLGGLDMDDRLVDRMVESFRKQHGIDLRSDDRTIARLRAVAEHTKKELSRRSRVSVRVEELAYGPNGSLLDLEMEITREQFVSSIGDLVERTTKSCDEAMGLAGIRHDQIADVLLVGGTTRIPCVSDRVARFFGKQPRTDLDPDHAIATGAALQAASLERVLARTPSLAARPPRTPQPPPPGDFFGDLFGDRAQPPALTQPPPLPPPPSIPPPLPKQATTQLPPLLPLSRPPQDVEIAMDFDAEPGPAMFVPPPVISDQQPAPKRRQRTRAPSMMPVNTIGVIDVTPRGLGIATIAGFCEELIRRNARVPISVQRAFFTSRDQQDTVRIVVCQGESKRLENNVQVGDLVLAELPARPRGETSIEVEFSLDASAILQVSARDVATGAVQRASLDLKGGMSPEEIEASRARLSAMGTGMPSLKP